MVLWILSPIKYLSKQPGTNIVTEKPFLAQRQYLKRAVWVWVPQVWQGWQKCQSPKMGEIHAKRFKKWSIICTNNLLCAQMIYYLHKLLPCRYIWFCYQFALGSTLQQFSTPPGFKVQCWDKLVLSSKHPRELLSRSIFVVSKMLENFQKLSLLAGSSIKRSSSSLRQQTNNNNGNVLLQIFKGGVGLFCNLHLVNKHPQFPKRHQITLFVNLPV